MRTGIMIIVIIALSACSRNNDPSKWVLFSKDNSSKKYYTFDKMSKTDDNLVKIWVKTVFNKPKRIHDTDVPYAKNMYMINCTNKKLKINPGFNFSKDNDVVSKTIENPDDALSLNMDRFNKEIVFKPDTSAVDDYHPIRDNSPASHLYAEVCKEVNSADR